MNSYLYPLVNVGARNNVNITDLGFLCNVISIPQKNEEQTTIVDFFNRINETSIFQQSKLELLKKLKQAYLQKLFP